MGLRHHVLFLQILIGAFPCGGQIVKNKLIRREVHFETGKWSVAVADSAMLKDICTEVADRDNYRITVTGHTDSVGNYGYNLELSRKRAEAVKRYIVTHCASAEKVEVDGNAYSKPAASNATEEGKQKNRRTIVALTLIYFSVSTLEPVEGLRPGATSDLKVLFEFNTAEFKEGSTTNLDTLAGLLSRYPDLEFEILGWTAISQSDDSDLSGVRAKAVYDYLRDHGVPRERMTHKGMGGAGCAGGRMVEKCRRVEIAITRNPYWKPPKPEDRGSQDH